MDKPKVQRNDFCATSLAAAGSSYEAPRVTVLGDVVTLTNGSNSNDTADKKQYYY